MATKHQERQAFIRYYREQTGATEIDMHKVADFALNNGWKAPVPKSAHDLLASEFSSSAREEIRKDKVTGHPYRGYHAFQQANSQQALWVDIDEAPRTPMVKSLMKRRDQMVGDGVQLTFDMMHWNRINPEEEPIVVPMDFTEDVEERINQDIDEAA